MLRRTLLPVLAGAVVGSVTMLGASDAVLVTRTSAPIPDLPVAFAAGAGTGEMQSDRYQRLVCESQNNREQRCRANIQGDVRIVRQMSGERCREGRNWEWNRDGIRVWDGCRAEFEYRGRSGWGTGGGSGSGGSGNFRVERVTCQSRNNREDFCPANIDSNVRVARQLSDVDCREGRNYSWNRQGVRVWGGCRAEFEYRPRRPGDDGFTGRYQRVTCQSQKGRDAFCPGNIGGDVRVLRQLSDTQCREGVNWTWSRDGVRVRDGCRAEFEYRPR
jgi:Protein of unknown function (DUF3011)